jgi:hypothetical protein
MKSSRFFLNVVGVLAITTMFFTTSFESVGQEQLSEDALHDQWFAENNRCSELTDQQKQDTCWTNLIIDMLKFPEEHKTYKEERKKRAWDAGERNNWEDDPCKLNYYGEFSMNDMKSLDPKESADLTECSAKLMFEDSASEN